VQFPMPENLLEAARARGLTEWLRTVPEVVELLAERWSLSVGDPFRPGGQTAWVAPVRRDGGDFVLKVAWRHFEAESEVEALEEWVGDGSVLLHASCLFDETRGLLLERCRPGTTLELLPPPEQDVVVTTLLRRLWREPRSGHTFRPLADMCEAWANDFEREHAARGATIDAGLVREGLELLRGLPSGAERVVLLCTDLHPGNVLAAEREPWLVIDPKPFVGDPTYDALQHMLNSRSRLEKNPKELVRRMADLLDLDPHRLLLWLFARCVPESLDQPWLIDVARTVAPR
jgi:streptomycin 6-kinase